MHFSLDYEHKSETGPKKMGTKKKESARDLGARLHWGGGITAWRGVARETRLDKTIARKTDAKRFSII